MTNQTKSDGISPAFSNMYKRAEWWAKRAEIIERDNKTCRNCSSHEKLQVHHKQYHWDKHKGFYKSPWLYPNYLLITLCSKCHSAGHLRYKVPTFTV